MSQQNIRRFNRPRNQCHFKWCDFGRSPSPSALFSTWTWHCNGHFRHCWWPAIVFGWQLWWLQFANGENNGFSEEIGGGWFFSRLFFIQLNTLACELWHPKVQTYNSLGGEHTNKCNESGVCCLCVSSHSLQVRLWFTHRNKSYNPVVWAGLVPLPLAADSTGPEVSFRGNESQ